MRIRIKALDTLFFRDGKPFERGDESWADGIFPPPPSVFYGALRTLYFSLNPDDFHLANKENDPTKSLVIKGIYFYSRGYYFPCPKDFVKQKKRISSEKDIYHILKIDDNKSISSFSLPKKFEINSDIEVEYIEGFIEERSAKNYIQNGKLSGEVKPFSNYFQTEPKVGIGRDNLTQSVSEGLLYRVGMMRYAYQGTQDGIADIAEPTLNSYFVIDFENLSIPEQGLLKLGGEGKAISYEEFSEIPKIEGYEPKENIFKLYLLTPAIFENGWLPKWLKYSEEFNRYEGVYEYELGGIKKSIKLGLLTASLGKSISLGGFDMKKKKPKSMYKIVPSGSVYYFEVEDSKYIEQLKEAFHLKSISDILSNEGYGLSILSNPNII